MQGALALPSGTVTFLFTDIENSTLKAEQLGNLRWADALEAHRELLRSVFDRFGGVEVGTEGDSFFVAFARAGDAVNAAIDAQRVLDGQELRVRIGMHTGEALVRGNDYIGHDVHKAKRVADTGHGGQIVVSQTTADLVAATHDLIDLGAHRLKDLGEPERIHQVRADGLDIAFPPLRSLGSFGNNLPLVRSSFVGREAQLAAVKKQLETHRLVTLTGIGGCGKTRLSLQVAAELLERYLDGVYFVELGPITSPDGVPLAIAAAVGLPSAAAMGPSGAPRLDAVAAYLARRACLVVLDNCEHLLDAAADAVERIQQQCPDVSILATSRELLGVEGEQGIGVPSLALPTEETNESEAVALFVERARSVRPEFDLTNENAAAVAEICRRLDGIPLAIEFAAARVSHLSPKQIAQKLDDRFRLLTGGRRHVQRQHTLAAALDWSYDLASDGERVLLRRLGVFPSDFNLEAVEGICSDEVLNERDITDLLGSLASKSLVEVDASGEEVRYRLLETVRAYAAEHLAQAGEADALRDRHRDWFVAFGEAIAWPDRFTKTAHACLSELANIRAACDWSEAGERPDLFVRLIAGTWSMWMMGAATTEDQRRFVRVAYPIEATLPPDQRAVVLFSSALVAQIDLDIAKAIELADQAVDAARNAHPALLTSILSSRGLLRSVMSTFTGDPESEQLARQDAAEALSLSLGRFPDLAGFASQTAASHEMMHNRVSDAIAVLEPALQQLDPTTHATPTSTLQYALAVCLHVQGDSARANALLDEVLAVRREEQYARLPRTLVSTRAAGAIRATRSLREALDLLRVGHQEAQRSGVPGALEEWVACSASVFAEAGDFERAARLLGFVRAQSVERRVAMRSPSMYVMYRADTRRVAQALPAELIERCRAAGAALSIDQAVAEIVEGAALIT